MSTNPNPSMTPPRRLMIVMYHYVRRIAGSQYPEIKGRETKDFVRQLGYLKRHHHIVTMDQVIAASNGAADALPENAVLLTFDDGYVDHYSDAFPVMQKLGVSGTFFVPVTAITERRMLDVNKIHFLLAGGVNIETIVVEIDRRVQEAAAHTDSEVRSVQDYKNAYGIASRFDTAEVIYVKRMLQRELPQGLRQEVLDDLFRRWVSSDERDFADHLYMSEGNLREMSGAGMTIGAHSANHYWLDRCDVATQTAEIASSAQFLAALGYSQAQWTFCYPYGARNEDTLRLLRQAGFQLAVTTELGLASIPGDDLLLLPRLDTNDLPIIAEAMPNQWSSSLLNSLAHAGPFPTS